MSPRDFKLRRLIVVVSLTLDKRDKIIEISEDKRNKTY